MPESWMIAEQSMLNDPDMALAVMEDRLDIRPADGRPYKKDMIRMVRALRVMSEEQGNILMMKYFECVLRSAGVRDVKAKNLPVEIGEMERERTEDFVAEVFL